MHFIHRLALTIGALLMLSNPLLADGKVYVKLEEIPTTIPYQRAAIFFDQGKQTLILQSQYEIPGKPKDASMAWIVPVPSVPDIASCDADIVNMDPFLRLDLRTRPNVTRISDLLVLTWLGITALTPLLYVASKLIKHASFQRFIKRIENPLAIFVLGGVVFMFASFFFASAGVKGGNVEIISAAKTGIHDVQVIKADKAADLITWFNENGFQSGPEDEAAIQSYIDRGWCFVASRIDPIQDAKDHSKVYSHLLAPLILTFDTPHPVYPTALTATGGYETEILIYLATQTPYATNAPIKLRGHRNSMDEIGYYTGTTEQPESMKQHSFRFQHLTKYKSTLTPSQMATDIEFQPGQEIPDYHEHAFGW